MKRKDYIEVGGLKWAKKNAGANFFRPYGKLYTYEEAKKLENEEYRLPTMEEFEEFFKQTRLVFDPEIGKRVFVDQRTGKKIDLYIEEGVGLINANKLRFWGSAQHNMFDFLHTILQNIFRIGFKKKKDGSLVRLVRR